MTPLDTFITIAVLVVYYLIAFWPVTLAVLVLAFLFCLIVPRSYLER